MNAAGTRLSGITRELVLAWQQTRDSWTDAKALEFEAKYISELVATVDRTVGVIDQLDKVIQKVRNDCE